MGLFSVIGKIVALPVRILNVPAECADKALRYAENDESGEPALARPGRALAETIEEAFDDEDW